MNADTYLKKSLKQSSLSFALFFCVFLAEEASVFAKDLWIQDENLLLPSLSLTTSDVASSVKLPLELLEKRVFESATDPRIEPVVIPLKKNKIILKDMAQFLSISETEKENLLFYFLDPKNETLDYKKKKNFWKKNDTLHIKISPEILPIIKKEELIERFFEASHHKISIEPESFAKNPDQLTLFLKQISNFLPKSKLDIIKEKIAETRKLSVDYDLLPSFAKKMIKKFTIYRGPNCFQAAMSFQDEQIPFNHFYNPKIEAEHHPQMINHDELLRILELDFYPIPLHDEKLAYGDVLLFLDVPQQVVERQSQELDFRWFKHTAVYLFGNYVFSKGSKSPNTPYTIKTLDEEWRLWKKYSKNLAVRAFRRNPSYAPEQNKPLYRLAEWLD
ncbi:MAG: hypothetical protein KA436_03135 [Oligoflexales bacterium]|nr:hypothetical protein [Oligoflexales bacterium]